MVRNPAVAGQFYPATKAALQKDVERYLLKNAQRIDAIGVMAPHAGYVYSGAVAGATLSSAELKDTCIIMGPNHTGEGKPFSIMTQGTWKSPLGDCEIDTALAEAILRGGGHLQEDEIAHRYEHSVEVQVPFIQALKSGVRIVPIVLSHAGVGVYRDIGRQIAAAVKEGHPATIIASSDMTHYEPQDAATENDKRAIEAILELDEGKLMTAVERFGISMCGYAPVCAMLAASKELGAKSAKLIKYQTSGDVSGDYSAVVGYAGIVVY